jgi:6-phosphogluconolactonase
MLKHVLALALALGAGGHAAAQELVPDPGRPTSVAPARWALTTSVLADTASVWTIADGALALHSVVPTVADPRSIAVHPSGRLAYLASRTAGRVQVFRFDAATGTLSARGWAPLPGAAPDPQAVAVEPVGRFLYVADYGGRTVLGFAIHPLTGGLMLLPGFPLASGGPSDIVFDKGGHAFVANLLDSTVAGYRIEPTGQLTPVAGSPFATPVEHPRHLALDPGGRFLYATHGLEAAVSAFRVDAQGALAPVPGSPFATGTDVIDLAASVDGRTLYVSDPGIERVFMRRIDPGTGALSNLTPPSVAAGNNVEQVQVDPSGRFVYLAAASPGAVFSYAVDAAGVLTAVPGSPVMDASGIGSLALVP